MIISQLNVEMSLVSTIRTLLSSYFTSIALQADRQVFMKSPDTRVAEVVFPVVAICCNAKLSVGAGLGKIGTGGRRQSKRTLVCSIGVVGRTAMQTKRIEEVILGHFENCVFLPIYSFSVQGVKQELIGHARMGFAKSQFNVDAEEAASGSDLAICSYHLSYYTDL